MLINQLINKFAFHLTFSYIHGDLEGICTNCTVKVLFIFFYSNFKIMSSNELIQLNMKLISSRKLS